jgi:hypothetical protein
MRSFLVVTLAIFMMASTASAVDICAQWTEMLNTLYVPVPENITGTLGNDSRGEKLVTLSACSIPGRLVDLQAAKDHAYTELRGEQNCSLEDFANLIREGGWKQPVWTLRCVGDPVYNEALVTVTEKDGETCAVRVNLPQWISGLKTSIARDGYLDTTGQVVIRNQIKNVTELKLFNATT